MYTKEYDPIMQVWDIFDDEEIRICSVEYEGEADALLSHLNRE